MKPRFSILVLTHNRLDMLKRFFSSLRPTMARSDVQMVVLDNGSELSTRIYLAGVPYIRPIFSAINLGVGAGRNELLKHAEGEMLIFLDSDCEILNPHWLDGLVMALEPESVGIAGPAGAFVDWNKEHPFIPAPVGECDVVSGWCMAFKPEILKAGVKLDTEYGMFWEEDSDFCMQARFLGWDVVNTGGLGVHHQPGMSGDNGERSKTLARFRDKWRGMGLTKFEGAY